MRLFILIALLLLANSACKREKAEPTGPIEVEYRVTSSTGSSVAYISYTNETGGTTEIDEALLPFSIKLKFSQRPGSLALLSIVPDQGGQQQSVTGTILVNGQPVKSETGQGARPAVNIIYVFQ